MYIKIYIINVRVHKNPLKISKNDSQQKKGSHVGIRNPTCISRSNRLFTLKDRINKVFFSCIACPIANVRVLYRIINGVC